MRKIVVEVPGDSFVLVVAKDGSSVSTYDIRVTGEWPAQKTRQDGPSRRVILAIRKFQHRAEQKEAEERLDREARYVLRLAAQEASGFRHNYVGSEHLLLGLIREDGIAAKALANVGAELHKVRSAVEFIIGRGDSVAGELPTHFTPRVRKIIRYSLYESSTLGHANINTGDLLLGLLREGEGIAVGVLESLGVNLERTQAAVMEVLEDQKNKTEK